MIDVIELVKKNFKNLIRAKASSLVVILGPLIVILLAGLAFDNSNLYAVKVGVYRPDESALTDRFIESLHSQFKVKEYQSQDQCVEAIKSTDINTCMVFDGNFTIGVQKKNQIQFYVDYSKINLVWAVMKVMTEKVGEQTLEASTNLTKILLSTLDYTQQRVGEERSALIRLTTTGELINKNTQELQADLGDQDLGFDDSAFPVDSISHAEKQLKQWVDASLAVGDKGLSKATSFINAANDVIKTSSASTDTKNKFLVNFQKNVADIIALKGDFATTRNLTQNSFAEFDAKMNALTSGIADTKNKLAEADTTRQFSLRTLDAVRLLLDKSLISILEVQGALNDIDNHIKAIEIRDPNAISQPIVTSIRPIVQEKTYLNYLFPVLIILVTMFTALLITPTLILLDKNSPASFRTYMTPVKDVSYVLANFITSFIILFIQMIIVLSIVSVFFSGELVSNVPKALLILLLANSLFILIGMIVGYAFKSEETATLGAVSVGALFLFISDVIIPLESMPEAFAYIASFNPYVLSSSLLRRALLFDSPMRLILPDMLILIGYVVATALIATGTYLMTRKYTVQQLIKGVSPFIGRIRIRRSVKPPV